MMNRGKIGDTGLEVSALGFGTSALGDMPDTYGYSVDGERARATLRKIFDGPGHFLDTSNNNVSTPAFPPAVMAKARVNDHGNRRHRRAAPASRDPA